MDVLSAGYPVNSKVKQWMLQYRGNIDHRCLHGIQYMKPQNRVHTYIKSQILECKHIYTIYKCTYIQFSFAIRIWGNGIICSCGTCTLAAQDTNNVCTYIHMSYVHMLLGDKKYAGYLYQGTIGISKYIGDSNILHVMCTSENILNSQTCYLQTLTYPTPIMHGWGLK